jgi:hypothetical protein
MQCVVCHTRCLPRFVFWACVRSHFFIRTYNPTRWYIVICRCHSRCKDGICGVFQTCARVWNVSGVQGVRQESVCVPPTAVAQPVSTCLSPSVLPTWWPTPMSVNCNVPPATSRPESRHWPSYSTGTVVRRTLFLQVCRMHFVEYMQFFSNLLHFFYFFLEGPLLYRKSRIMYTGSRCSKNPHHNSCDKKGVQKEDLALPELLFMHLFR